MYTQPRVYTAVLVDLNLPSLPEVDGYTGVREFLCQSAIHPSHLRSPRQIRRLGLHCALCNHIDCKCPSGVLTPLTHAPYAFIIHRQQQRARAIAIANELSHSDQHFWSTRLQSSSPRVWANVDSSRMYLQTMSDQELLEMLQPLGEAAASGSIIPHHVTMLQQTKPRRAVSGRGRYLCTSNKLPEDPTEGVAKWRRNTHIPPPFSPLGIPTF
jgi:hypothetical protein